MADDVSVQTYRDIYAIALEQISQLDIGAKEMEGLLVMCNRTEVHAVLSTYPDHLLPASKDDGQPIAVKVDTVVRVAGATCRHGLLFQTYKGWVGGWGPRYLGLKRERGSARVPRLLGEVFFRFDTVDPNFLEP